MKRFVKIVAYAVGGLLVFIVLLAAATQTQFFRDRLRAAALANLHSLLDADITLGELRGNLVTGFSIDSVAISVDGAPLLIAERIDLRYSLLEIPGRTISVNAISIVHPTVRLVRPVGGQWNFARMIRPTSPDTSTSRPLDWTLRLNKLEIQGGSLDLTDSVALTAPEHSAGAPGEVEYHKIALREINLLLAADIRPSEKQVDLSRLSFRAEEPSFEVKRCSGEFAVTPTAARVRNLVITTGASDIRIDASLGKVDLLGGINLRGLKQSPVSLSLRAQPIDFNELKSFLPPLAFLEGQSTVNLTAGGEFGDVQVQKLDVRFGASEMLMKGNVLNLHDPGNLALDVRVADSKIEPKDPLALMPSFQLPDFSSMGTLRLAMDYQGTPLAFHTKGMVETSAGAVESDVRLEIGGPPTLRYDAAFTVRELNLAKLLDNDELESRLNAKGLIKGEGVTLATLNSSMTVDIDSSVFRGEPLRNTRITMAGADRSLRANTYVQLGVMSSTLTLGLRQQEQKTSSFSAEGEIRSLRLASILSNESNDYLVTLRLRAKGKGLTARTIGGDLDLDYTYWQEQDTSTSSGNVRLHVDQSDSLGKILTLESTLGSVSLTGDYDLQTLPRILRDNGVALTNAAREQFAFLDTSLSTPTGLAKLSPVKNPTMPAHLNLRYTVRAEDLDPLRIVIPQWQGFGRGEINGTMTGNPEELSLSGRLAVDEFAYGRVEGGTLFEGGNAQFELRHIRPDNPLGSVAGSVKGTLRALHINTNELDNVIVDVGYDGDTARFSGSTVYNGEFRVAAAGRGAVAGDTICIWSDSLAAAYREYAWTMDPGARVRIAGSGLNVDGVVLRRNAEQVRLDGMLGAGGTINGSVVGSQINLAALKYLLENGERTWSGEAFAGKGSFSLQASGSLSNPRYTGTLTATNVEYRTVPFGDVHGQMQYADQRVSLDVSVDDPLNRKRATPELVISGSFPLRIGSGEGTTNVSEQPMDVIIRSDSLEVGLLDPLLPTFDELRGRLTCDITVKGTPRHPEYGGLITLKDCSFLFVPNNMMYLMDGTFRPQGERIQVVDAVIRNIPADETAGQNGLIHIRGDFALTDLKPGDFQLSADGKLLVVKESTRKSSLSVYGRLFVEIGSGGLRFTGSIDNSLLKGDVLIVNSMLIFPPTRTSSQDQAELSVPMVSVNDTARVEVVDEQSAVSRYFGTAALRRNASGEKGPELPTKSFMDGVHYDLNIETSGGNAEIRMVFNPVTSEELVAAIDGRFSIVDDGRRWFGDLTIQRASYNFFKRFNAEGKISYVGDFVNPNLDITASYDGTRKIRDTSGTGMETTEDVAVTIKITGTRFEPKLAMSMKIAGYDYVQYPNSWAKSNDLQSDAIQFILYGSFPLTTSQKNDVANDVRSTVGTSLLSSATSLLTGTLSDFLRTQTGFISSVELNYGSGESIGQRADIRLSGVAFNGLWRYGGKILTDPLSNANFSLLYSFGTLFSNPSLRNFMFELERRVQDVSMGQTNISKGVNSARLFYRFSF